MAALAISTVTDVTQSTRDCLKQPAQTLAPRLLVAEEGWGSLQYNACNTMHAIQCIFPLVQLLSIVRARRCRRCGSW